MAWKRIEGKVYTCKECGKQGNYHQFAWASLCNTCRNKQRKNTHKHICKYCNKEFTSAKLNTMYCCRKHRELDQVLPVEEVVKRIEAKGIFKVISTEGYKDTNSFLKVACLRYGHTQMIGAENGMIGRGCKRCRNHRDESDVQADIDQIYGEGVYQLQGEWISRSSRSTWLHVSKGHTFTCQGNSMYRGYGCQLCNGGHAGVNLLERYLQELGYTYEKEKSFKRLLGDFKHRLPFDFYLPDLNLIIEYDGRQHFKHEEYFGTVERFKKRQEYDLRKVNYLHTKKYNLLRLDDTNNTRDNLESIIKSLPNNFNPEGHKEIFYGDWYSKYNPPMYQKFNRNNSLVISK